MKITPINPEIPFSDKVFNVEMTGLELGLIKSLFGVISGNMLGASLNHLTVDTFKQMSGFRSPYLDKINLNLSGISKKVFENELNELNK